MSDATWGQVHAALPPEIEDILSRHMAHRGLSRSQAVRNAILVWGWLEDQRAEGRRVVSLGGLPAGFVNERELMWP